MARNSKVVLSEVQSVILDEVFACRVPCLIVSAQAIDELHVRWMGLEAARLEMNGQQGGWYLECLHRPVMFVGHDIGDAHLGR